MSQQIWNAVDHYLNEQLVQGDAAIDAALQAALEASDAAGLPAIAVAPNQGKLLHLLARLQRARSILEIGTLGGYSTIWLASALPDDGRLVTLEADPKHAEPVDFCFIDADKQNIPEYFEWALKLARPGSLIVVDNVVRGGAVIDAASEDASVRGVRRFNAMLRAERRVSATAIQTVGSKGYDGLAIALVVA